MGLSYWVFCSDPHFSNSIGLGSGLFIAFTKGSGPDSLGGFVVAGYFVRNRVRIFKIARIRIRGSGLLIGFTKGSGPDLTSSTN